MYIFGDFELSDAAVSNNMNNVWTPDSVRAGSLLTGTPKWSRAIGNGISYTCVSSYDQSECCEQSLEKQTCLLFIYLFLK